MPLLFPLPRAVPRPARSNAIFANVFPSRIQRHQRSFATTQPLSHDVGNGKNHYETLKVPVDASPAQIKKSFYSLSKSHHPDRNPGDPSASARFHSISEAYAVLGTPDKRAAYDRDVVRTAPGNTARRGSYHSSTGSAGGRPASGLSRRKSSFRGPPPSFYRSGGWGNHAGKRRAAHEDSTGTDNTGSRTGARAGGADGGTTSDAHPKSTAGAAGWSSFHAQGGMGPGQDPFGHALESDVPHFDRQGHTRTHRAQDQRRAQRVRMGDQTVSVGPQESTTAMFVTVSGVLFLTFFLPYMFFGGFGGKKEKEKKKKKEEEEERRKRKTRDKAASKKPDA